MHRDRNPLSCDAGHSWITLSSSDIHSEQRSSHPCTHTLPICLSRWWATAGEMNYRSHEGVKFHFQKLQFVWSAFNLPAHSFLCAQFWLMTQALWLDFFLKNKTFPQGIVSQFQYLKMLNGSKVEEEFNWTAVHCSRHHIPSERWSWKSCGEHQVMFRSVCLHDTLKISLLD